MGSYFANVAQESLTDMTDAGDRFTIPSSYPRIVARELGLQERDLHTLLTGTGLPRDILLPGDESELDGPQLLRVLQNARRLSGSPALGLRLGHQLQPSAHGPLGYLALSSPDLATALEALRDFLPARIPFAVLQLENDGAWLTCAMDLRLRPGLEEERLLLECFALIIQSVVEAVLGRELSEGRVTFAFPRPEYHAQYPGYLHSPICFDAPENRFLLPAALARHPNVVGEPASYALARDLCQRLLEQAPGAAPSTADRVRRLLLSRPGGAMSETQVARALFVSRRTLARRLQEEGQGYRRLQEAVQADLARRYLRDGGLTVEAVAALLGYHDSANFRRAFRRWTGTTPSTFRSGAAGKTGQSTAEPAPPPGT